MQAPALGKGPIASASRPHIARVELSKSRSHRLVDLGPDPLHVKKHFACQAISNRSRISHLPIQRRHKGCRFATSHRTGCEQNSSNLCRAHRSMVTLSASPRSPFETFPLPRRRHRLSCAPQRKRAIARPFRSWTSCVAARAASGHRMVPLALARRSTGGAEADRVSRAPLRRERRRSSAADTLPTTSKQSRSSGRARRS